MTETNPAAEAEKIKAQLAADAAAAGATVKTDATAAIGDIEEVEVGAQSIVKSGATTALDALKDAQAGVQAGVAAAKADVEAAADEAHGAIVATSTSIEAGKAHGAASSALSFIENIPGDISAELKEAKAKLTAALGWIEAHFTTQKKPVPTAPAAAPTQVIEMPHTNPLPAS